MEQSMKANPSIQCSVERCHYHNNEKNVCSLAAIQVGTCGPATPDAACTECSSFKLDKNR